jgi:anti-sigma factor RsiW
MSDQRFDREAFEIEHLDAEQRREVLSAYLDDELSPEAARHVTAWLDEHPDALRDVEHLRRMWDLLELYEDERVSDGFTARVLEAAGVQSTGPKWGRVLPLRRPATLAAAAAVLLVGLGVGFLIARPPSPSVPTGPSSTTADVAPVPEEYLEEVDVLLALSDEEFSAYLLADLEEPWGDGS